MFPLETIRMKCQILFSGENKKKKKKENTYLLSAKLAKRVVKVKQGIQSLILQYLS